jgi:hypothetical protein
MFLHGGGWRKENLGYARKCLKMFHFQLSVWEDDVMLQQFNMLEEIRDFTVVDKFIYTVRDRDVCINELMPGGYFYCIYS